MKLDPSIIALKDFKLIKVFRLKLARYSTADKAPSINASEQSTRYVHNMTPNVLNKTGFVHNINPNYFQQPIEIALLTKRVRKLILKFL